ncbi:MAG: DUF1287 domain-containing protein, partial [Hyphomicrobiaceae bacterium]
TPVPPVLPSLALLMEPPPPVLPSLALLMEPPPPVLPSLALLIEPPPPVLPSLALLIEPPPPALPSLALLIEPPPPVLPTLALLIEPPPPVLPSLALLIEPPPPVLPTLALLMEPPPPALPSLALLGHIAQPFCAASRDLFVSGPSASVRPAPGDPVQFGLALAAAAQAQLKDFVIYNAKYQRIRYPMGDVPSLFGVCTDVIVRAYRSLGIDLQALVQETGSGRGDRNIDHRRVEVVRGFLARNGEVLPISDLAEDYQPGDIVTYYRPQNRSSTSHIAIVTEQLAPSGRPMIVHNRGWGPEMEDALFVDKITGHYRFSGLRTASKGEPAPASRRVARH